MKVSEKDSAKLQKLVSMAQIGWWEADFNEQVYYCSEFVADLLGLIGDTISFREFGNLISEDYRERVLEEFRSFQKMELYEQIFPIHTKYGEMWISTKVGETFVTEEGHTRVLGMFQCISRQQMNIQEQTVDRLNTLLYRLNGVSKVLLDFLHSDDTVQITNNILEIILKQLKGDRTYIFEYDFESQTQSCISEIVAPGIECRGNTLQLVPIHQHGWWSKQILAGLPIVLFNFDRLPSEAIEEKIGFERWGVKSVMAVPLYSKNGVWGYLGIDIVRGYRNWSNEDYQWFTSLANIMSICLELHKSEISANVERQYLHTLYKHMPIGFIRLKFSYENNLPVDYKVIDANEACEKIVNKKLAEFKGKNAKAIGVNLEAQWPLFLEVLDTNIYKEVNFRLPQSGKICHFIIYSPFKGEIVVLFSDMTETFEAHEALDRSEKILRNIYKNLPVGIELYDKDGYLIDINDKELDIFGLKTKEDALGVNLYTNPIIPDNLREELKEHKPMDFTLKYDFDHLGDYYETGKNGAIDLITKATPLFDSAGNLIYTLLINIDNTETTNAYSKIQEFEDFFTLVGEYAKVGYAHFNAITREGYAISSWYQNVGEKEGTPLSEIIGIHGHFHPEDRKVMLAFFDEVFEGKATTLRNDMRILRDNGQYTWTRVNVVVKDYHPEEGVIEMICVNYDITELKETEFKLIEAKNKAETLDRLKSAFIANMSHEIRTPLNAIVGFSSLLVDTEEVEERKQYIAIVQENTDLLLQLISDILDLSRIESETFEFVKTNVDVNQLCNELAMSLSLKASASVEVKWENSLSECHVLADKNRLTQVMTNFMNNALKFTPSGSIVVGYDLTEDNFLKFYVRDTGIGIPADKQKAVFERFVKLNSFVQGTGLGLSICKSIVEQMGGKIGLESKEGEGSCFWFTYPYI